MPQQHQPVAEPVAQHGLRPSSPYRTSRGAATVLRTSGQHGVGVPCPPRRAWGSKVIRCSSTSKNQQLHVPGDDEVHGRPSQAEARQMRTRAPAGRGLAPQPHQGVLPGGGAQLGHIAVDVVGPRGPGPPGAACPPTSARDTTGCRPIHPAAPPSVCRRISNLLLQAGVAQGQPHHEPVQLGLGQQLGARGAPPGSGWPMTV